MVDNISLETVATPDAVVRTDDDGTAHWQYVKIAFGADNTQTIVGSISSNPFPVALSATDNAVLDSIDTALAGTLTVGSHAVTNAGTFAVQVDGDALTALQLIDNIVLIEDAVHSTGASGIMPLAVRNDVLATLADTDGDYAPLQVNASGALFIQEGAALDVSAATVTVDASGVAVPVTDNGANLSTDWGGTVPPIGAGVEATALRVTLATDSTGVVSVDDNGAALTVDNAGTFATQVDGDALTALQLIDNIVNTADGAAGATPTGVAPLAVRDDSLSALTPIEGDFVPLRVNSTGALHVTGGGGGTQYNIDDVAGGTDTGTLLLAVRDDALTTLTPIDGDYTQLRVSSTGALHVTGGGGGTEYTEDVATPAPIVGTATMMERDDALSTLTPIEGDWVGLRSNARGALWVELDITNDVTIADGGNAITVDWAGTAPPIGAGVEATALRVTLATDSTGVVSVDDNGANLSVDWAGTVPPIGAGTEAAALRVTVATDSTGVLTVDNSGTFATQVDGDALTALQLLDDAIVVEDAAAAANPSGNVVMTVRDDEVGATALTTADNDVQALRSDRFGALKTTLLADATSEIKYAIIDAASSGDNTIQAAAGAGIKIRVLSAFLVAAGTVNTRFESGAGGTALTGQMNLVVNSGFTLPFNPGGWFETADNALLNLELSAAVSVDGCVTYVEV
jgi:hypothetical protein